MTTKSVNSLHSRQDRVRAHTKPEINRDIDQHTSDNLSFYANADKGLITRRLSELDNEWDMERLLETNAAAVSLGGLLLAAFVNRKWFALPAFVAGFLLMHATQGWCPPVPVFRRMGVRTRKEIERERYALKLLRGDFEMIQSRGQKSAHKILAAVDL